MTDLRRRLLLVVASTLVVVVTAVYLVVQVRNRTPEDDTAPLSARGERAALFFRSTADATYSQVSFVPAGQEQRAAVATPRRCDRIDVLPDRTMVCMKAAAAVLLRTRLTVVRSDGTVVDTWQVPGTPSRVRFSPSGRYVASTTFVAGHSYTQAAFSTSTIVHRVGGGEQDLEDYALTLDGERRRPVDRNYWGVTFVDDRTFYATLRTRGATWLVRGDRQAQTLSTLRTDAECPSLSPDGTRLVYKKRIGEDPTNPWRLAVLDLASGEERLLDETRSVDDQVEWLDDDTVLYALPRPSDLGRSDVWEVGVAPGSEPAMLVGNATSPSVVADRRAEL